MTHWAVWALLGFTGDQTPEFPPPKDFAHSSWNGNFQNQILNSFFVFSKVSFHLFNNIFQQLFSFARKFFRISLQQILAILNHRRRLKILFFVLFRLQEFFRNFDLVVIVAFPVIINYRKGFENSLFQYCRLLEDRLVGVLWWFGDGLIYDSSVRLGNIPIRNMTWTVVVLGCWIYPSR